jgi:hypothetical protein
MKITLKPTRPKDRLETFIRSIPRSSSSSSSMWARSIIQDEVFELLSLLNINSETSLTNTLTNLELIMVSKEKKEEKEEKTPIHSVPQL